MNAEFSEATFQQNYLEGLRARLGAAIVGATEVPPPRLERDLAFDAMCRIQVGAHVVPIFLQFKIPALITRSPRNDNKCWRFYAGPHYRFGLHRDRQALRDASVPLYRQHNLLKILRGRGHVVFYASPLFHARYDLDTFANHLEVSDHTIHLDPLHMPAIYDRDVHHVSYSTSGVRSAFHSELIPLPAPASLSQTLRNVELVRPIDPARFRDLADDLVATQETEWSDRGRPDYQSPPEFLPDLVRWTADTLHNDFGAALALIPSPGHPRNVAWDWRPPLLQP